MSKSQSKSRMLLLELLLAVFIFSFCVIICAGVFFQASNIARDSKNLTYAVQAAQSAAEAFKATDTMEELAWLMDGYMRADIMTVFYDSSWNIQPVGSDGDFALFLTVSAADGVETATIHVVTSPDTGVMNEGLYKMTLSKLAGEVAQ